MQDGDIKSIELNKVLLETKNIANLRLILDTKLIPTTRSKTKSKFKLYLYRQGYLH